ncbi:MAG TPA: RIP metalloprotease RseP [Candidatus Saccharimonadales bacterium]|nr:RIP metalloprotease RseP [Candidatus Saccharimonadales bacterium]
MNTFFGILTLGFIILIHEWGHYIAARLCKVRVDVFSIGFGPRLFGIKRGDTDWRLSAVPLGGYVRMAGQDITDIDSTADSKPTGAPDELLSKTRYQRAFISFAGPAVNLLFPILLLGLYFAIAGDPYPAYFDKPMVIQDLPAAQLANPDGLHPGDKIISLNGKPVSDWRSAYSAVENVAPGSTINAQVDENGVARDVKISVGTGKGEHIFGYPPIAPQIAQVVSGKAAYHAGVQDGDLITSVDGRPIKYWDQLVDAIHESGGKTLQVGITRKSQAITVAVTPSLSTSQSGDKVYQIGVAPEIPTASKKIPVLAAFKAGAVKTYELGAQTIDVIVKLVTGRVSVRDLQSVIGISRAAGEAVSQGPSAIILFMVFLSVQLGILNLLPIPILDGGHILLLSLEGIRRRDFSLTFKERFIQVGLVFLLALVAYVMFNDVRNLIPPHS